MLLPLANKNLHSRIIVEDAYQFFFLVAYGIWLGAMIVSTTFLAAKTGQSILNLIRYVGLGGAILSSVFMRRKISTEVLGLALLLVISFVIVRTNAPALVDLVILVYCGRRCSFKRIARETVYITSAGMAIIILLAEIGAIQNYTQVVATSDGNIRVREYIGFLYALQPAQLLFNVTCLIVYLLDDKFDLRWGLLLMAANIFVYAKTNSRLSFFISVAVIVCALVLSKEIGRRALGPILRTIAPVSFVLCFIFSWYAVTHFSAGNMFQSSLDAFLGNRLKLGQNALMQYGTTIFGQSINFIGNGLDVNGTLNTSGTYNYVDILYVRLPILYGWIFTALFIAGMTFAAICAMRRRQYSVCLVLIAIAFHGIVDDLVIRLQFCTFLFLIGTYACQSDMRIRGKSTTQLGN